MCADGEPPALAILPGAASRTAGEAVYPAGAKTWIVPSPPPTTPTGT